MTEDKFEKIEAFLEGEIDFAALSQGMTKAEAEAVRAEVEEVRRARMAVFTAGIRQDIAKLHGDATAAGQTRRLPAWYGVAAAAVLIVVAGVWWLRPGAGDAYAEYAYQDPGLPVVMGVADDPAFAEAMTLFKQGDFAASTSAFLNLGIDTENDTLTYYYGASAYYAEQYSFASGPLGEVAQDASSLFREKAEWLLILTYLETGRTEAARDLLTRVTGDEGHLFHESGRSLAEALSQ